MNRRESWKVFPFNDRWNRFLFTQSGRNRKSKMVTAHFGTEMLDLNKSGNVRIGRSQFQAPESEHVMPAVITPCICGLNKSIRHSNSLK